MCEASPDRNVFDGVLIDISDPSGSENKEVQTNHTSQRLSADTDIWPQELDTSTAILKKKKKPNTLM